MRRPVRNASILLGSIVALCPVAGLKATTVIWRAQDFLTGQNGNTVLSGGSTVIDWFSTTGTSVEADADGGIGNPTLLSSVTPAGTAAVSFTNDRLNGSALENPVAGTNQFSIALVFRATAVGVGGQGQWWQNSGIVDAEQAGNTNDWGLAMNSSGQLGLGTGGNDVTGYTSTNYADSTFHTALFRYDGVTGNYDIFVDDASIDLSTQVKVDLDPRNSATFGFGAIAIANNFFTGDLAEVRFYTGADSTGLNVSSVFTDLFNLHFVAQPNKTWSGQLSGLWNTATANFSGSLYVEGNQVTFGDLDGNGAAVTRRNITIQSGGVSPSAVVVDNSSGDYSFAGAIKNASLTKRGSSSATLGGAGDSTDNPGLSLTVEAGTVILAKDSSVTAHAASSVSIKSGATVQLAGTGGDQILDSGQVLIDGTFNLNGKNEIIGSLIDTGTASGVITNNVAGGPAIITINKDPGMATYTGTIQDGIGSIALVKVGAGTQVLTGANTYTGGTTVSEGILRAGSGLAFGDGIVTVNAGGGVEGVGAQALGNQIVLNGGTLGGVGGGFDTYNGVVTVNASSRLQSGGGGIISLAGGLTGSGSLTKIGTGTISLLTDNSTTYSGALTINAGTIQANAPGALGTGAMTVNGTVGLNDNAQTVGSLAGKGIVNLGGAILTVGADNASTTFTGTINGSGGITKMGTGVLTLGGTNNYTGATTVTGGILRLESLTPALKANWSASVLAGANGSAVAQWNDSLLGIPANSFNGSPTLSLNALNGQNVVHFGGGQALEVLGQNSPVGGLIDYSVAFVFRTTTSGVGGASNWWAHTGLIDAEQGGATNDWGIAFDSTGQVGAGNGNPDQTLYSNGGLADGQAHVVIFSVSGDTLTLNVDGANTTTTRSGFEPRNISRILFGSLNGDASRYFVGDIGQVSIYDRAVTGRALRLVGANLATTYGLNATALYPTVGSDVLSDSSAVVLNGASATLDLNGLNETIGSLTGVSGSNVVLAGATLTIGSDNTDTNFAGNISGQGAAIKIGTGALTLAGNNTTTGNVTIKSGKLVLGNAGSANNVASSPRLTIEAGATLDTSGLSGGGLTLSTQRLEGFGTVSGGITTSNGSILAPGSSTAIGTLTVGNLSITAGTTLNYLLGTPGASAAAPGLASFLNIQGNLNLGTGLIFNPISNANANGQGVLGNGVYDLFGYTGSLTGFTGNNFQTPSVGTFTFLNQNNHIYVQVSGLLSLAWTGAASGIWDATAINWANGNAPAAFQDGAIVTFGDTSPVSGNPVTNSSLTVKAGGVQPGGIVFNNGSATYTINSADLIGIAGVTGIAKNGTGTIILQGANSFTGSVNINNGVLRAANSTALGNALEVTVAAGAALELDGGISTTAAIPLKLSGNGSSAAPAGALRNVSGTNTYSGGVTLMADATIGVASDVLVLTGVVGGIGNLTKSGAGTLILSGANTYTGGITINAGIVKLGNPQALGANDTITTVNPGASIDLNGQAIRGRGYTAVVGGTGVSPTTGAIFNSGLSQPDASFDAIALTADTSIGGGGGRFDIGRASVLINDGAGRALTKIGAGTLGISNASTGFSSVSINGGTILAENDLAYGDDGSGTPITVTVNAGGTAATSGGRFLANNFVLNGGTLAAQAGIFDSYSGTIAVTAPSSVSVVSGSTTIVSNSVSGTGSLTKAGAGTLVLGANNSPGYSGSVTVSAGTLQTDAEGALGKGALLVNGTASLNNNNQTVASLSGFGTISLGTATLTTGTDGSSSSFAGSVGGTGQFRKVGAGTLTLGGGNTYTGATLVEGGTLRVESAVPPAPKANWSASTLTGDGTAVTQWLDQVSGVAANTFVGSPTLNAGTLGGQNVVHFGGNQALEIAGPNSPIANATEYAVAVVFRTSTPGVGDASNWWSNTGLVDAEQGGTTNDWGVAFNSTGQVGAGNGNPDQTIYSQGGLADGNGHVALFSASATQLIINIDGVTSSIARTGLAARNVSRVLFGSLNGFNFFNGDIAQVLMYDRALGEGEYNLLGVSLSATYGFIGSTLFDPSILPDLSPVVLSGVGTTLDLSGKAEKIGSLSGGVGTLVTLGAGKLTSGEDGTDTVFGGIISGTGGIAKAGGGKWTLSGASTYSGTTEVMNGRLAVNGSLNGTSSVIVTTGGVLGGRGTITTGSNGDILIKNGGKLAPGDFSGQLTLLLGTGVLDLSEGVNLLDSRALAFFLGTDASKVFLGSGTLKIGNGVLEIDDFDFSTGAGYAEGVYTLFDSDSAIVGTLGTHLSSAIGNLSGAISTSPDGEDIILTVVPEPGSAISAFAALSGLLGLRRFSRGRKSQTVS